MRFQQAIVRFCCHRLEKGAGNILGEIDSVSMRDRQCCLFLKFHATRDGIDPDRIVGQERRSHEDLSEFRADAVRHVLDSEEGDVVDNFQGSYGRGIDWVDESKEDLEGLCGLYDVDHREIGVPFGGLRDGEHVTEDSRGDGKDEFMDAEILELRRFWVFWVERCSQDKICVWGIECVGGI